MLSDLEQGDVETLRRCLRDVTALSTLPVIWSGAEPARIAESLAAALFTTLDPDFAYVTFFGPTGHALATVAQIDRYEADASLAKELTPELLSWARSHDPQELLVVRNPRRSGSLRVAMRPLGNNAELGLIAAGFARDDLPTTVHSLLLNIAASEGLTAIRNALLLQSLRQSEERFRALVDASAQIVWTTAADGSVVDDSPSWRAFTGQTYDEWKGSGWLKAIHPEDGERTNALWREAVRERAPVDTEYRLRHISGEWRWTSVRAVPRFDNAGHVQEWVGMNIDITARKTAEKTQQLLLDELNHRVKNTLANVQAIAQHTLRRARSPADFVTSFSGRIQSLARVHTQLTATTWKGADLKGLIRDQLVLVSIDESRFATSGPGVALDPQIALHMALVLHELATNSHKYGALSAPQGRILVTWRVRNGNLQLLWQEHGGPPASAPTRRGFGTTLIEGSLRALGGRAQMLCRAEGVSWEIELPLPALGDAYARPSQLFPQQAGEPSNRHDLPERDKGSIFLRKRILVVEDEVMVALELADILSDARAEPIGPVHSVEQSLAVIRSGALDAALVDANLRGSPVDEVAAALTQNEVPFAFVTGYARESLPRSFQHVPMIGKPFTPAEVMEVVGALLSSEGRDVVRLRGRLGADELAG